MMWTRLLLALALAYALTAVLGCADSADAGGGSVTYTGVAPITVDNSLLTIGLNAATAGDLLTSDGTNWVATRPDDIIDSLNMQPYLGLSYQIALNGVYPSRNGVDPYVGELMLFGGNFTIRGWAPCEGQLLDIASHTALFSLLGTTYGGDGETTFGLPDLRGRVAVGIGAGPGLPNVRWGEEDGVLETLK